MQYKRELSEQLKGYKIVGDIVELRNLITSKALVATHLRDIICALSERKTNYVRVGYGETLAHAYKDAAVKGRICRLIHVYYSYGKLQLTDLNNFINGLYEDVIFGYSIEDVLSHEIKLVMIFN